uniref:Peroxisomal membrane protein 11A n=1 Tax=Anthurium amnicola TaxID=1678845 RepID=A0A1D1XP06_9ARAE
MAANPSATPDPSPPPPAPAVAAAKHQRDFLLHLEAYLAKRDGVDKLLKISRYAAKVLLASSAVRGAPDLAPRLKAFESSLGVSRKAFRLGKFVQDLNALRSAAARPQSPGDRLLSLLAYGGEGVYYFVEQFVWLSKAGLIGAGHSKRLQKVSAWAELIGYVGSIVLKVEDLRKIRTSLKSVEAKRRSTDGDGAGDEELRRLPEKLLLKELSVIQDLADALMAIGDVREWKGFLSSPLLMALAGLLSALISTHKNWSSC